MGDLDGDGVVDLAAGAPRDDIYGTPEPFGQGSNYNVGAAWILFLRPDGSVHAHVELAYNHGGLSGPWWGGSSFGLGIAHAGDLDGDGISDLAVGTSRFNSMYLLHLNGPSWQDLGGALAGTHGTPLLAGQGTLLPAEMLTLALADGLESTPAAVVVGATLAYQPLLGGTLVPWPDVIITGFATDGAGRLELQGPWPDLPPGETLSFQVWLLDPSGPFGLSASNGLRATPP